MDYHSPIEMIVSKLCRIHRILLSGITHLTMTLASATTAAGLVRVTVLPHKLCYKVTL